MRIPWLVEIDSVGRAVRVARRRLDRVGPRRQLGRKACAATRDRLRSIANSGPLSLQPRVQQLSGAHRDDTWLSSGIAHGRELSPTAECTIRP